MTKLYNLPDDFGRFNHWVAWREELTGDGRKTKVPYQATDSMMRANPTNPDTWNRLSSAVKKSMLIGNLDCNSGVGFVITHETGLICIDLDDPTKCGPNEENARKVHSYILEIFQGTYIERSPSGTGYHIWFYGYLPDGRQSLSLKAMAGIEMYANERYMTMTGDYVSQDTKITNQQNALNELVILMTRINGGALPASAVGMTDDLNEYTAHGRRHDLTDEEVVQLAIRNNSKFLEYFNATPPNDRSRFAKPVAGDLDKITSLPEQILRIMSKSPIGRCYTDAELERKLFKYWLNESRASNDEILRNREEGRKMMQLAAERERQREIEAQQIAEEPEQPEQSPVAEKQPEQDILKLPFKHAPRTVTRYATDDPPGVIGELARQIRNNATMRSSIDFSHAAAFGLFSGLSAHAYRLERINGGLYMLMIGMSGQGKDAPSEARDNLRNQLIAYGVPREAIDGLTGPNKITSPQGLHRRLENSKPLYAIVGEGTLWLHDLSTSKVGNNVEIKRFVLDLYGKMGAGRVISPSEILNKDNKLGDLFSPAMTILLEGERLKYLDLVGDDQYTSSGLCARFIHIESDPDDVRVKNYSPNLGFSDELVQYIAKCIHIWMQKKNEQSALAQTQASGVQIGNVTMESAFFTVRMTDECVAWHRAFDGELDHFLKLNEGKIADVYNRVIPNVLRVCVNIAAGINPTQPVVTKEVYMWAQSFVLRGLARLGLQIEQGETGTGDMRIYSMIVDHLTRWKEMLPAQRERMLLTSGRIKNAEARKALSYSIMMPQSLLQTQLGTKISRHVNAERAGETLQRVIDRMTKAGDVVVQMSFIVNPNLTLTRSMIGLPFDE